MLLNDLDLLALCGCAHRPIFAAALAGMLQAGAEEHALAPGEATLQAILTTLARNGLVEAQADGWALTQAGRGVVQTALIERLKQPACTGEALSLALDHLDVLRPIQVARALRLRRTALENAAARLSAQHGPAAGHRLAMARADLDWTRAFLSDWEGRYPAARSAGSLEADPDATLIHRQTALSPAKKLQRMPRPRSQG